jgi:hypothetical protein
MKTVVPSSSLYRAAVQAAAEFSEHEQTFQRKPRHPLRSEATQLMSKSQFLALKIDLNPAGRTAFYDAVRFACDERMNSARDFLRVIVVISDGEDTHSRNKEPLLSIRIPSKRGTSVLPLTPKTLWGGLLLSNTCRSDCVTRTGLLCAPIAKKRDTACSLHPVNYV